MFVKKVGLIMLLGFFSVILGLLLGSLDFFGFLDERHNLSISLVIFSVITAYLIAMIVFILDFSDKNNLLKVYSLVSLSFGLVIAIVTLNLMTATMSSIFFFLFLRYIYKATLARSKLFVKFSPRDILLPVVRQGFLFLLILFASLSFIQTKELLGNDDVITPQFVKYVSKPIILVLNNQLALQLQSQLGDRFEGAIGTQEKEDIIRFVLQESVEAMEEGKTRQLFGMTPDNIPIEQTIVYPDGQIDLTPVVDRMLPDITQHINNKIGKFAFLTPFLVAFFVIIIFQTVLFPLHIVISLFIPFVFSFLLYIGFVSIKKITVEAENVVLGS